MFICRKKRLFLQSNYYYVRLLTTKNQNTMTNLKMYINGKFVESRSGEWIDVLNPSTEEVTSRQPAGTVEDVDEAVNAAYQAQKQWAKTPSCERAVYLHRMADGIRKNFDKFQEILVREQG